MIGHHGLQAALDWAVGRWYRWTYCSWRGHTSKGGWYCLHCATLTPRPRPPRWVAQIRWLGAAVVSTQLLGALTLIIQIGEIGLGLAVLAATALSAMYTTAALAAYRRSLIDGKDQPPVDERSQ